MTFSEMVPLLLAGRVIRRSEWTPLQRIVVRNSDRGSEIIAMSHAFVPNVWGVRGSSIEYRLTLADLRADDWQAEV